MPRKKATDESTESTAKPKKTVKASKPTAKAPTKTTKPKAKAKVTKPTKVEQVKEINVEEEFPHSGFPYKLVHQDGNETRTCYFMNEAHLNKHIERYRLDRRKIKLLCRHDYENPA